MRRRHSASVAFSRTAVSRELSVVRHGVLYGPEYVESASFATVSYGLPGGYIRATSETRIFPRLRSDLEAYLAAPALTSEWSTPAVRRWRSSHSACPVFRTDRSHPACDVDVLYHQLIPGMTLICLCPACVYTEGMRLVGRPRLLCSCVGIRLRACFCSGSPSA